MPHNEHQSNKEVFATKVFSRKINFLQKKVFSGHLALITNPVVRICQTNESSLRLPISSQYTFSLPLENIRKSYAFLLFSGGRERVHLGRIWVSVYF